MSEASSLPASQAEAESAAVATLVREHILGFISSAIGLAEALPNVQLMLDANHQIAAGEASKFFKKHGTKTGDGEHNAIYSITQDHIQEARQLVQREERARTARQTVPRSLVVAMVSEFDAFLSGLVRLLFIHKPDLLATSDRQFSYKELCDFGGLEQVRDALIEKELEVLLRKSHTEQFDWLESKFGLVLRKELAVWGDFIELTERRNLFVHNAGIVNSLYLSNCVAAGFTCGTPKGVVLPANEAYLTKAQFVVLEVGIKLGHVLWRKVLPNLAAEAEASLGGVVLYDLVDNAHYELAVKIGTFALRDFKKFKNDHARRLAVLNLAQAYKWSGQNKECHALVDSEDWSSAKDLFHIGVATLKDDVEGVAKLMRAIGNCGQPGKEGYRRWPIFKEMRNNAIFQNTFEEVFAEPWQLATVENATAKSESDSTVH
jgi:hypothetical protein